jgi:hypothetical protein
MSVGAAPDLMRTASRTRTSRCIQSYPATQYNVVLPPGPVREQWRFHPIGSSSIGSKSVHSEVNDGLATMKGWPPMGPESQTSAKPELETRLVLFATPDAISQSRIGVDGIPS